MLGPAAANRAFYAAFAAHDADAMEGVWAEECTVSCAHPGKPFVVGRSAVLQSWREVLAVPGNTPIPDVPRMIRLTADVAIVLCTETLGHVGYVATNIFVCEHGHWRMAHHQAGPTQKSKR